MQTSIVLPLLLLASLGLYKLLSSILARRAHAAKAEGLGCDDAPLYPNGGFMGLNNLKNLLAADKRQLFMEYIIARQNEMDQITGRKGTIFKFNLLGQHLYYTSDPKIIQAMLATQFSDFSLGTARRNNMLPTLGDGIFVQDGKAWEHSRALLRPSFVRELISDLDLEERHVQNLIKQIKSGQDGWTTEVEIQTLFFRLTIDSATDFLFGESVDSQLADTDPVSSEKSGKKKQDERGFSRAFDNAQGHLAKRFRLADMYWLHNPEDFRDDNKIVNNFVMVRLTC